MEYSNPNRPVLFYLVTIYLGLLCSFVLLAFVALPFCPVLIVRCAGALLSCTLLLLHHQNPLPFILFILEVNDLMENQKDGIISDLLTELRKRWASLLPMPEARPVKRWINWLKSGAFNFFIFLWKQRVITYWHRTYCTSTTLLKIF